MRRKCDRCENEATVHEVVIRGGERQEKHLCESCAREQGPLEPTSQHASVGEVQASHIASKSGVEPPATPRPGACPSCGMTFADFRQSGVLGCADCYKVFEPQLGPMIERAHEGATHHTGKSPKRGVGGQDRAHRIAVLRKQLQEAIIAEQYERAANLRDMLLEVEKPAAEAPVPRALAKDRRTERGSKK